MNYQTQSIPTLYNNILFRSRLEATWACFFDLCGWMWLYEPLDLKGWVPDFEIYIKTGQRLLVEVKPENLGVCNWNAVDESPYKKALNHIYSFDLLLLGVGPFDFDSNPAIGILLQRKYVLEGEQYNPTCSTSVENHPNIFFDHPIFYIDSATFKTDGAKCGFSPYLGMWDDWTGNVYRKRFDYKNECYSIFNTAVSMTRKNY